MSALTKITTEKIRSLCTDESFERGMEYYREGRVRKLRMENDEVVATVAGSSNYAVTVTLKGLESNCTCPYDWGGYCKHIVAVLLTLSRDYETLKFAQKNDEAKINGILNKATTTDLKNFLKEEVLRNANLAKRFGIYFSGSERQGGKDISEYRRDVESLYRAAGGRDGFIEYHNQIDFSSVTDLAELCIRKKNPREASRIYQALSEVIAENMNMVDDSNGYYGEQCSQALNNMVKCLGQAALDQQEKRQHISYLFEKYLKNDTDYFQESYEIALQDTCTTKEDLNYWLELLRPHLPNVLPASRENWEQYYGAKELLLMQIYILEALNEMKEFYSICQRYSHEDEDFCLLYAERLVKDGNDEQAISVAEEGLARFRNEFARRELLKFLKDFYEKRSPVKYKKALETLFLQERDWDYYYKLKRLCSESEWKEEVSSLAEHLADAQRLDEDNVLVNIYLKEEMFDEALKAVLKTDNLRNLRRYHRNLASRYPREYFLAYKQLLLPFARSGTGRNHYSEVAGYLKLMKNIDGYELESREFVNSLENEFANKPAFLDEIRKVK